MPSRTLTIFNVDVWLRKGTEPKPKTEVESYHLLGSFSIGATSSLEAARLVATGWREEEWNDGTARPRICIRVSVPETPPIRTEVIDNDIDF